VLCTVMRSTGLLVIRLSLSARWRDKQIAKLIVYFFRPPSPADRMQALV